VKLVDALDSKSSGPCVRVGSIPTSGTRKKYNQGVLALLKPLFFVPGQADGRWQRTEGRGLNRGKGEAETRLRQRLRRGEHMTRTIDFYND
jgi:hypothetical protein